MKRYMLDTNTVSHLIRRHPAVSSRVVAAPMASLCISAITAGELAFGLTKRPEAKRLHLAVQELLRRVDVLSWDGATADRYGAVRAKMERLGPILAPLDLLIGAHALATNSVLVTSDKAFGLIEDIVTEDWSASGSL